MPEFTCYAAIDATDAVTGTVHGIGPTPSLALYDASQYDQEDTSGMRAVPCTDAASCYVAEHGGAPSPLLSVSARGVCLRSEEEEPMATSADPRRFTLDGEPVTIADLSAQNKGGEFTSGIDFTTWAAIGQMQPGDSLLLGGGAGAEFILKREA